MLWKVRVGAPWRDLPDEFGPWNSVFKQFRRWAKKGVFEQIFNALSGEPDFEYAMIDGTIIHLALMAAASTFKVASAGKLGS